MNGILLIDKEKGMTSRDVVNTVSKKLNIKKIGHTGTLDPFATGVLVLCVGKATKAAEYITGYDKVYEAEIKLGIETDTLDITGKVIKTKEVDVTEDKIKKALDKFVGLYSQQVPKYSAVKIKGKRLYKYARNNEKVELPTRDVNIYSLELISSLKDNVFTFRCKVSKGTYIRSLAKDIANELGTLGILINLRRTKQGDFDTDDCVKVDDEYKYISISDCLPAFKKIVVDKEMEEKIRNGAIINKLAKSDVLLVNKNNEALALYKIYEKDITKMKPIKVF